MKGSFLLRASTGTPEGYGNRGGKEKKNEGKVGCVLSASKPVRCASRSKYARDREVADGQQDTNYDRQPNWYRDKKKKTKSRSTSYLLAARISRRLQ